jgi:hypothetical protein
MSARPPSRTDATGTGAEAPPFSEAESEQWLRLRDALLPQLATSLESAHLVDEVRRSNRDRIAALSRVMKEHPVISDFILSDINVHPIVRQIARSSHERHDGAGYPDGLAGHQIPEPAWIVLVADAFDAPTTDRPYRPGASALTALEEIRRHAGTQFCPRVVEQLEALYREEPGALDLVDEPLAGAA